MRSDQRRPSRNRIAGLRIKSRSVAYDSDNKVRLEILLLVSTLLFGVTTQILLKDYSLEQDLKGLLFESLVLLLFGSYLYLLLSWGNLHEPEKSREYEQISITQLLVLNGIMISILVSYAISLIITEDKLLGQNEEGLYLWVSLFLFVVLPVMVYFHNPTLPITLTGVYPLEQSLKAPLTPMISIVSFLIVFMFSLVLAYLSKVLNIVAMASLVLYLPYLGIKSKEDIYMISATHKRTIEKVMGYSLLIYRQYSFIIFLTLFYDLVHNENNTSIIKIILIMAVLLVLISVVSFVLKRSFRYTLVGSVLLVLAGAGVGYIMFIAKTFLLSGLIFLMYFVFVITYVGSYIITAIVDTLVKIIETRFLTINE